MQTIEITADTWERLQAWAQGQGGTMVGGITGSPGMIKINLDDDVVLRLMRHSKDPEAALRKLLGAPNQ